MMRSPRMKAAVLAIGLMAFAAADLRAADDTAEVFYVQAAKAKLKAEPKMDAKNLADLKRGDSLTVLQKQEIWFQVSYGAGKESKTGWISKLFVNAHKPVGAADLSNDVKEESVEKSSRKRAANYAVSASTRGLSEERVREGREQYEADFQGLEKVDAARVPAAELDKFQKSGSLSNE